MALSNVCWMAIKSKGNQVLVNTKLIALFACNEDGSAIWNMTTHG